jgi:hypothetical protein
MAEFDAKVLQLASQATTGDKTAAAQIVDNQTICSVETITPVIAALLFLELNKHNRDFSLSKAQAYAQQMRLGYWRLIHQGLAFYADRKLADGQHRIAAVILSDAPQRFTVFRNFDKDALEAIDTSKRRTAGEAFGITGLIAKDDSKIAGAIVESVMKYEARRLEAKTISPSIYEQKDWAMKHLASLRDTLAMVHRIVKGDPVLSKPETGAIALGLILGGYTAASVETYLGDLLQSVGRYPDSPAVDLHRQFLKSKERSAVKGKLSKEEKMALAFKGAGLYAEKLSTGGLRWKAGKEPLPAPVPPTPVAKAA